MSVTLHTNLGPLKLELYPDEAPVACDNFLKLCASGYYDGTLFHRNIKGFMVQGGDPTGTGKVRRHDTTTRAQTHTQARGCAGAPSRIVGTGGASLASCPPSRLCGETLAFPHPPAVLLLVPFLPKRAVRVRWTAARHSTTS